MLNDINKSLYTNKINISQLRPGDILAHDIYFSNGTLLAKAGMELTHENIATISQLEHKVVTLNLTKVYRQAVEQSKLIVHKAASGQAIEEDETMHLLGPFIKEANREHNLMTLLYQLKTQDEYTFQHTVNIGIIAMCIGKWLGYKGEDLDSIALAGALHDIGKSCIPLSILNKPARLTHEEFKVIRTHTTLGYNILERQGNHRESTKLAALQHHERADGKGYPYGLSSDSIHPYAKIIAVADVYHAMTSKRVYQAKTNPFRVLDEIQKKLGSLDSKIILCFVDNMISHLMSTRVLLNNGQKADVISIDKYNLCCPVVKVITTGKIIDLKKVQSDLDILDVIV